MTDISAHAQLYVSQTFRPGSGPLCRGHFGRLMSAWAADISAAHAILVSQIFRPRMQFYGRRHNGRSGRPNPGVTGAGFGPVLI